jgi:nucleosome binding factor SPN SPT16 subunit
LLEKRETTKKNNKKKKDDDDDNKYSVEEKLAKGEITSYENIFKFPKTNHNMIIVDEKEETVLLPINGTHVPFHISTIKNFAKSEENDFTILRINFKNTQTYFGNSFFLIIIIYKINYK